MTDTTVKLLWNLRFRGKFRLLSPLVDKTGERIGRVFGSRLRLDLADHVQRQAYLGTFERHETRRLKRELRPGMTFVDIGANCGYFTCLAVKNLGQNGRVLAVEPSPKVAGIIAEAIESNGWRTVTLERCALGNAEGILRLYAPPPEIANHAPTAVANPGWTPINVPVKRLDQLLDEHSLERVDVMKIDVEGYESVVFDGAEKSLAKGRIRAMLVEFNAWNLKQLGIKASDLWKRIESWGFRSVEPQPAELDREGSCVNCFFRLP